MNKKVELLLNDNFKLLKIIYDNSITIQGETYCPLSQDELANEMSVSRFTISNIIKVLKDEKLIYTGINQSKKYKLTDEALAIVKSLKKIK